MTTRECIDVTPVRINASDASVARALMLLSPGERAGYAAFATPALQTAFALRRAARRVIVARHIGTTPAAVRFTYGAQGKPAVVSEIPLHLSASSSGDLAVIACSASSDIGIDVEQIRPLPDLLDVAATTLDAGECAALREVGNADRERAFFVYWTRKEARLKATGEGFGGSGAPRDAGEWSVSDLRIDDTHACALAHRAGAPRITVMPIVDVGDLLEPAP